ncbi:uncharacterized protein C8A04DRAFT_32260 [Dichotomopilus funicola]|uniref:Uncharacterized protein n=1 Tax=Dichotomopilus funicola TaxID=1934379 RepID=A0AAN6UVY7_9PEZI|nr:hypothetical protein C8A04DRAFT_32260 [Dichotomopilus funicola]
MLCGIQQTSPHHHTFLRSFRSHKSLRQEKESIHTEHSGSSSSENDMHRPHRHRPSDASSMARPSFDSTISRKTDLSIDWDPLRLHPSLAPGPVPPLRDIVASENATRRHQPQELRHDQSSQAVRARHQGASSRSLATSTHSTVIYGGFDFGFDTTPTPAVATTTTTTNKMALATHPGGGMTKSTSTSMDNHRAPSPTPSDASSEFSLSPSDDWGVIEDDDAALGFGLAPPPAPRARPRPRPNLDSSDSDSVEYFLRRGGWKRRGIVFVDARNALEGEDETWEI